MPYVNQEICAIRKGLQHTGDLFLYMGYNCLEITS